MLKITKGLKKKKKGKKSKHKEDELFDSAELEEYRRQQQEKQKEAAEGSAQAQEGEQANHEESEEWLKFKALTSGVDDILKKTQGDLDRIKSTSFFQKKPPGPSEPDKRVEPKPVQPERPVPPKSKWVGFEESTEKESDQTEEKDVQENQTREQIEEQVEEEEEESEFEDDQDDIFDTSFVDVVASGEVKLAYVPDSPIEDVTGPDPFDTSIVDRVIKVDPKEQKRNLITLGCAVEVLSGKLDKSPCKEVTSTPRKRPKAQDLLLGSFDEGDGKFLVEGEPEPPPKSILDDDPVFEEETSTVLGIPPVTPLAESKPICAPAFTPVKEEKSQNKNLDLKGLVDEFVPITDDITPAATLTAEPDELDDEFAALAAESLSKKPLPPPRLPVPELNPQEEEEDDVFIDGDDPFDTSFATQVLPGKFELKIIEKEILDKEVPVGLNSVEEKINNVLKNSEPTIRLSKSDEPDPFETELEPLSIKHRDLLGGSTTDLTKIDQPPIAPKSLSEEPEFEISDPFDTSIVEVHNLIGKTELKFLEKELLDQNTHSLEVDDDFDPRAEEKPAKHLVRPDKLSVGKRTSIPKVVAFDVEFPKDQLDLLAVGQEDTSKHSKPLTPYYPSKAEEEQRSFEDTVDPFDTSFISNRPGKFEIKIIEKELAFEEKKENKLKHSVSDPDFDPRGETEIAENNPSNLPDILTSEVVSDLKLHTPVTPRKFIEEPAFSDDIDPFDTSIASALVPGKAEIKILENELIHKEAPPIPNPPSTAILEKLRRDSESFSSLRKSSITDVLGLPHEDSSVKPLTPLAATSSFEQDDIDPFDTSCVGDILPGKTEIKLLESELMLN